MKNCAEAIDSQKITDSEIIDSFNFLLCEITN